MSASHERVTEFLDLAKYVAERVKAGKPCPLLRGVVTEAGVQAGIIRRSDDWLERAAAEIAMEQPSPDSLDRNETLAILRKHCDGLA